MTVVLGPEVRNELATIHGVARALRGVKTSLHASFNLAEDTITVSQESLAETVAVLSDVGKDLADAADRLVTAVEVQTAEFFNYMKEKESVSVLSMLQTRSIVPQSFRLVNPEEIQALGSNFVSHSPQTQGRSGDVLQNSSAANRKYNLRAAVASLQTCLFLMMESVLTRVNGTRAAVYVAKPLENPYMLCRVGHIHGEGKFPIEVSYSNTSTLVTAVQSGMAVNFIDTSNDESNSDGKGPGASKRPLEGFVRHSLRVKNGVIIPISNYGCVVVADKTGGAPEGFTPFDEHQIWAFAIMCEGLFPRYPRDFFMKFSWDPAVGLLRQCSRLPAIRESTRRASTQPRKCVVNTLGPSLDAIPFVTNRLIMLRAKGNKVSIIENPKGIPGVHLTLEGLFQEASEYVRSIETLWQKSVDDLNARDRVIEEHTRNMEAKTNQITLLEAEIRRLQARLFSYQA